MLPTAFPLWSALVLVSGGIGLYEGLRFLGIARRRSGDPRLARAGILALLTGAYAILAAFDYAQAMPVRSPRWALLQFFVATQIPTAYVAMVSALLREAPGRLQRTLFWSGLLLAGLGLARPDWVFLEHFRIREIALLQQTFVDWSPGPLGLAMYGLALLGLSWGGFRILRSLRGFRPLIHGPLAMIGLAAALDLATTFGLVNLPYLFQFAYLAVTYGTTRDLLAEYFHLLRDKEALVATRSRLLTNISHELRTPLGVGLGYIELLERRGEQLGATERDFVIRARKALLEETELIDQLIELSRFAAEAPAPKRVDVRLADLVRRAADQLQLLADRKELKIVTDIPESLRVAVDERWFTLAVKNLLHNAIKFTPAGGTVEVRAIGDGEIFRLSVRDEGCGISPGELDVIFERFVQGKAGRNTEGVSGMGIGLSLVRDVVQAHDGRIQVESAENAGSTFVLELPREPAGKPLRRRRSPRRSASPER